MRMAALGARLKILGNQIAKRLNRFRPRWLGGAGFFDFLEFFYNTVTDRKFALAAMGMAYRFFFAVFPALILLFTLIPYIPIDNLQEDVNTFLSNVVPADSLGFVENIVREFFDKPAASVIYINVALLMYASLSGIRTTLAAFSKDTVLFRRRNVFRMYAVSLLILLVLLFVFFVMMGLVGVGQYLIISLKEGGVLDSDATWAVELLQWIIVMLGLQLGISVIYYFGPETQERWKFFTPGSLVAGLLSLAAILGFRFFISNFANYNKIYGSIGAIMILMVWFYWLSMVLLTGFEINAAIDEARFRFGLRREMKPDDIDPHDNQNSEWKAGSSRNLSP